MTTPSRLRADAARNRANILRAARTLIAAHGERAGMDDIAREAGVAVGTLYRHFPTKADLVDAIVSELAGLIFDALDAAVARVDSGDSAIKELTHLIGRMSEAAGHDRTVKAAMANLGVPVHPDLTERAMTGLARLVAAGHAEGTLHPDITPGDLVIVMSTMPDDELPEAARHRWLELAMRSLAAPDATPPAGDEPSRGPGPA